VGQKLLKEQKLKDALLQFQRAFVADPGSEIALQLLEQTQAMIREQRTAPKGTIILTPAEKAQQEVQRRIHSLQAPPTLKPLNAHIPFLKMNNQPARVLYESVGKLAGINVLFDPQGIQTPGATHNFNLNLSNVSLDEALDYVALITHTFWKPISSNAIFVTQDTQAKRLEYEDEVVKVFYIQNAATPAEFSQMFNAIRTGAHLNTGIFQVPSEYAIVARGTPDTVALIQKLVHDLDRPKPEVLLDVIIMSVNKTKMRTIGASLLGQGGLSVPLDFTPRNPLGTSTTTTNPTGPSNPTTGTGTGSSATSPLISLKQIPHLTTEDYGVTLPSTLVEALMNDSSTRILQRPEVRAVDGGKAVLKIGQKIPYVSGSLNSAIATPGAIPYATTQFQQISVGTEIDFKPHVNGPNDISMHVKVDLSTLLQWLDIAGVQEPELGQQVDEADIRMKNGEVSLLGGLSDVEHNNTLSGFPGLTNLPLLNYIFGSKKVQNSNNEILIALVPHIVRSPADQLAITAEKGVYAGTNRVVSVRRAQQPAPAQPETAARPKPKK
jgi:general secretion pathway protein D